MLRALAPWLKTRPNVQLWLAGRNRYGEAARLQATVRNLSLSDRVELHTDLSDKQRDRLLVAADVFLCLSDAVQDNIAQTQLEAMARGLPVIGTRWNGIGYTLREDTGGLAWSEWAEAPGHVQAAQWLMRRLQDQGTFATSALMDATSLVGACDAMVDPVRRSAASQQALSHITNYAWTRIICQYEQLARNALDQACSATVRPSSTSLVDRWKWFENYPTPPPESPPLEWRVVPGWMDRWHSFVRRGNLQGAVDTMQLALLLSDPIVNVQAATRAFGGSAPWVMALLRKAGVLERVKSTSCLVEDYP